MSGWAFPETSLPCPMVPPGMAELVEVLGCGHSTAGILPPGWLRPRWAHAGGWGRLGGGHTPPLFWEGVTVGSLDLADRGSACVLHASLRVHMCPGGSLVWGVGTKDLCARLAPSSQALRLGFSICRCGPRSGYRSVLGLLAAPGGGTRSLESGAAPPSSGLTCSLLDSAGGAWRGHTAAGWGTQVGLTLHCLP